MKKNNYLLFGVLLFLGIYFIGNVSAAEGCCMKTKAGEYFKFVDESDCNLTVSSNYFREGIKCEDVGSFLDNSGNNLLEKGCCIDYNNFECSDYIYRAMCADEGLNFESSSSGICSGISLNPNPCTIGCCVVDGIGHYESNMECNARTNLLGEKDFRDITEDECLLLAHTGDMGACVESGTCKYGTRESCSTGEFYFGKYCSDPSLKQFGVSCTAHAYQSCSSDFEQGDVYWYDSCNNQEDIAIQCTEAVTTCGVKNDGAYGCISTTCSYGGEKLKSGESKCSYQSPAGNGTTFVGSVNGKVTCYKGKLDYKNCGDSEKGRTSICQELTTTDTGFTRAICIPNLVENCFLVNLKNFEKINTGEMSYNEGMIKLEEECNSTSNCLVKKENIGSYFGYEMCVPKDPQTFQINNGTDTLSSCSLVTSTCTIYFQKNDYNRYECVENCDCMKKEAFVKMNNLCESMGDCGMNINIKGSLGQEGLSYKPTGDVSIGRISDSNADSYDALTIRHLNIAGIVIPSAETLIKAILLAEYNLFITKGQNSSEVKFPKAVMEDILGEEYNTLTEDERQQRMIEYYESQRGSIEDNILLDQQKWSDPDSYYGWDLLTPKFWERRNIDSIIGLNNALMGYAMTGGIFDVGVWFGLYDTDTIDVTYQCMDWQASIGGDNCGVCNEGDLPCTEYKCHSLGQACILVNKDTDKPECVSSIDDGSAPKVENITSLEKEIYSIDETVANKNWSLYSIATETNCIPENSQIKFVLGLNEIAQCKYSFSSYSTYDEMPGNYPLSNGYSTEHTFNVDSGKVLEHITEEKYDAYFLCLEENKTEADCIEEVEIAQVDLNLKIRCSDIFGHFSNEVLLNYCIKTGPDEQAPQVKSFNPANNAEFEYNPGKFNLKMYLDEQAKCRYDYDNKINYKDFLYNMTQNGKLGNQGWLLSTNITNSKLGNNQIFIACNDSSGNINKNILYEYNLKRDITLDEYLQNYGLKIDTIYMENSVDSTTYLDGENITTGKNPVLILKVETSRGANNGVSTCYLDKNQMTAMKNTGSSQHSQIYSGLSEGLKQLYVECDDGISKTNKSISFNLTIDEEAPEMVDETTDGDYLTITTNEQAFCTYSNEDCNFKIDEGNFFYETDYVTEHNADWNPSLSYHIRCIDKYGNEDCVGTVGESASNGPIITRITYNGNELNIKTDRKAICYYSTSECNFDINNSESSVQIDSSLTQEHDFTINPSDTYFIKCKDQYGTVNPTCTTMQTFE